MISLLMYLTLIKKFLGTWRGDKIPEGMSHFQSPLNLIDEAASADGAQVRGLLEVSNGATLQRFWASINISRPTRLAMNTR
jgi:hypothetical protein